MLFNYARNAADHNGKERTRGDDIVSRGNGVLSGDAFSG